MSGARQVAPAVRTTSRTSRPVVPVRPLALERGRALQRNAALVGRRTIEVAVHRPRTALLGIATVAAVLLAVLFYLSQSFQAAAARYELDQLAAERELLLQELRTQDGWVAHWGAENQVVTWADDSDLDRSFKRQRFEAN